MSPTIIEETVTRMTPDEIRDGLWLVEVFERWGSMSQEEADGRRWRIVARQCFLELSETDSPTA